LVITFQLHIRVGLLQYDCLLLLLIDHTNAKSNTEIYSRTIFRPS